MQVTVPLISTACKDNSENKVNTGGANPILIYSVYFSVNCHVATGNVNTHSVFFCCFGSLGLVIVSVDAMRVSKEIQRTIIWIYPKQENSHFFASVFRIESLFLCAQNVSINKCLIPLLWNKTTYFWKVFFVCFYR